VQTSGLDHRAEERRSARDLHRLEDMRAENVAQRPRVLVRAHVPQALVEDAEDGLRPDRPPRADRPGLDLRQRGAHPRGAPGGDLEPDAAGLLEIARAERRLGVGEAAEGEDGAEELRRGHRLLQRLAVEPRRARPPLEPRDEVVLQRRRRPDLGQAVGEPREVPCPLGHAHRHLVGLVVPGRRRAVDQRNAMRRADADMGEAPDQPPAAQDRRVGPQRVVLAKAARAEHRCGVGGDLARKDLAAQLPRDRRHAADHRVPNPLHRLPAERGERHDRRLLAADQRVEANPGIAQESGKPPAHVQRGEARGPRQVGLVIGKRQVGLERVEHRLGLPRGGKG
jgi:hypothetical protein